MVITGASTGIGEACALHLDKLRFQLFAGVRESSNGEALKRGESGRVFPVRLDVTDASTIASAAETVATIVGKRGLAGLVNNAGIVAAGMLESLPLAALHAQLEVNVVRPIAVTQAGRCLENDQNQGGAVEGRDAVWRIGFRLEDFVRAPGQRGSKALVQTPPEPCAANGRNRPGSLPRVGTSVARKSGWPGSFLFRDSGR